MTKARVKPPETRFARFAQHGQSAKNGKRLNKQATGTHETFLLMHPETTNSTEKRKHRVEVEAQVTSFTKGQALDSHAQA